MKRRFVLAVAAVMMTLLWGCSTCTPTKDVIPFQASLYKGELRVDKTEQCFDLTIKNTSDKDIIWKWDKTVHLDKGNVTGKFTLGKESQPEDDAPIGDITIFPGTHANRKLCPFANRYLSRGYYTTWRYLSCGENSVIITLVIDGKETKGKVSTVLN